MKSPAEQFLIGMLIITVVFGAVFLLTIPLAAPKKTKLQGEDRSMFITEIKSFSQLKRGDVIRNLGSGRAYVIDDVQSDRAVAVRTQEITNLSEWELVMMTPGEKRPE